MRPFAKEDLLNFERHVGTFLAHEFQIAAPYQTGTTYIYTQYPVGHITFNFTTDTANGI